MNLNIYAGLKKTRHRRVFTVWFCLYKILEKVIYSNRKQISGFLALGKEGRKFYGSHGEPLGMMKIFCILIVVVVVVSQMCNHLFCFVLPF